MLGAANQTVKDAALAAAYDEEQDAPKETSQTRSRRQRAAEIVARRKAFEEAELQEKQQQEQLEQTQLKQAQEKKQAQTQQV